MDSRSRKELEECVIRILQHADMDVMTESKLRKLAQEETGFDLRNPDNRKLVNRVVERFFTKAQLQQQGREGEESHHDEIAHSSKPSVQSKPQLRQQPSAHSRPPPPQRRRNLIAVDDEQEDEEEGVTNVDSQRSNGAHAAPAADATGRNDKRQVPVDLRREEPEIEGEPASKKKKRPSLVYHPRRTISARWSAISEDKDRGDDIVDEEWDAPEDKEKGRKRESTAKESKITRKGPKSGGDCSADDDGDDDENSHLREDDDEEQTAAMKKIIMKRAAAEFATDQRESDRHLPATDEKAMEVAKRRANMATRVTKKKFPETDVVAQRRRRMMVMDCSEDNAEEDEVDNENDEEPGRENSKGRERQQHVTKRTKRQVTNDGDTIVCQLSSKQYVTVNELNGRTLVSIREYYEKGEDLLSTQKGITFTEDQWTAFKNGIPKIDAALRRLRR